MRIDDFCTKYAADKVRPIRKVVDGWMLRARLDDVLGTPIASGVLIGDLLCGGRLADVDFDDLRERIPVPAQEAFASLMGEKADTVEAVRALILEKYANGEHSLMGLLNKVQGQVGEEQFVTAAGHAARLAQSGSQEAWDVVVGHGEAARYVQVKIYADADAVIDEMLAVNEKVAAGQILGESAADAVEQVDFAVNSDILEDVRDRAQELGMPNEVLDVGATRDEIRSWLQSAADESIDAPLEDFFDQLLSGTLAAAALHAAVNGFLVWKGAKERSQAIEDTVYSTGLSAGGIATASGVAAAVTGPLELLLGAAGGPVGAAIAIVVGVGARAVLRRVTDRRFVVDRLRAGNEGLEAACVALGSPIR